MKNKEFKTPEELLDFVLTECSDINWALEPDYRALDIEEGPFDIEKIYYAYHLLIEKFNYKIISISMTSLNLTDDDFKGDWLSKIDVDSINLSNNNLTKFPEFNDSVESVDIDNNNIEIIEKLPKNLRYLDCQENPLKKLPGVLPKNLEKFNCSKNFKFTYGGFYPYYFNNFIRYTSVRMNSEREFNI